MRLKRSRSIVEIPIANVDRSRLRLDNIQKDFRIHIDMENYSRTKIIYFWAKTLPEMMFTRHSITTCSTGVWSFPASRGLSRRGKNERKERDSLLSLIFASSWETSASREVWSTLAMLNFKLGECSTVEARYNEGPRDWQNTFTVTRFRFIIIEGLSMYIWLLLARRILPFVIPKTSLIL